MVVIAATDIPGSPENSQEVLNSLSAAVHSTRSSSIKMRAYLAQVIWILIDGSLVIPVILSVKLAIVRTSYLLFNGCMNTILLSVLLQCIA